MEESTLKSVKKKINDNATSIQRPWVHDQKLQHKIEQEAHLRAEKNGFRNSAHFYLLSVARDFGCVLP